MNKNQVRAAKRDYVKAQYEWDDEEQRFVRIRHSGYEIARNAPHAPNKQESKELRRIMARTGLNEEQVRAQPQYRKQLSKAQKVPKKDVNARAKLWFKRRARQLSQSMNLPVYHPDVQKAAKLAFDSYMDRGYGWRRI